PGAAHRWIVSWLGGPSAQATTREVPGGMNGPSALSRRADTPRPAHRPYRAPAPRPNRAQRRPVTSPLSIAPRTPPSPAKPTMAPHARPKSPQLIVSLFAKAALPVVG